MRTLVLDQGYQPHRIVSWKRAISMFFDEKCEIVEEYDEEVYRSTTVVIKMPAVVRLLHRVRGKRSLKFSRMNVALRDNFSCQYCRKTLPLRRLTYDHVVPRSKGGKTRWENIVMACYSCNEEKADRTPEQADMVLAAKPVKPASLPLVAFRFDKSDSIPDAWANWLYWHGALEQD